MKYSNYSKLLSLVLLATPVQALELKSHTGPECGIESYNQKRDNSCGVEQYRSGEGSVCGVKEYNTGSGPVCGETCSSHCKKRDIFRRCTKRETTCTYNQCKNRAFGIAQYHSCRSANFGVESYKVCRKPEFGVELFKTCELYLTKPETIAFITSTETLAPEYSALKVLKQGDVLTYVGLKDDLACVIRKHENNPLSTEVVTDLKSKYFINFLEPYSQNPVDCSSLSESPDLTAFEGRCEESTLEDVSNGTGAFNRACKAQKTIAIVDDWFNQKADSLRLISDDAVARSDVQIRDQLTALSKSLRTNL